MTLHPTSDSGSRFRCLFLTHTHRDRQVSDRQAHHRAWGGCAMFVGPTRSWTPSCLEIPPLFSTAPGCCVGWSHSPGPLRLVMLFSCPHGRLGCSSLCSTARSPRAARWPSPARTHPGRRPPLRPLPLHRATFEDGHRLPRSLQTQMPKVGLAWGCSRCHGGCLWKTLLVFWPL